MLMANENGSCGRAESLVTYIYGELPAAEALEFQAHAARCVQCGAELLEFGGIHRSMADWRKATLGQMAEPVVSPEVWKLAPGMTNVPAPRRSLLSSLAGFLTVTPRWAQAGLAAAMILVVVGVIVLALRQTAPAMSVAHVFPSIANQPMGDRLNELIASQNNSNQNKEIPTPVSIAPSKPHPNSSSINRDEVAVVRKHVAPRVQERERNPELALLTKDLLRLDSNDRNAEAPRLSDMLTDGDAPMVEPNQ